MNYNKTYPKSIHNRQCIGPCYFAGTQIVHPITLQYINNTGESFCPTAPFVHIDKITGKKETLVADDCYHPTENKDLSGKEFEMNILNPNIEFNHKQFLNMYYDILSFEDAVEYISNKKYTPVITRLRIIDCALIAFGYELSIFDNRVVEFFIEIINNKWMDDVYKAIYTYIYIDDDKIYFANINNKNISESSDIKNIKYNFIKSKFVTNELIYKFLSRYLKHRKDNWDQIIQHSVNIKNDFIIYIENKITSSLKNE